MTKLENCLPKKVPKTINSICPECKIKFKDCGCSFNCPACDVTGVYQDDHIFCPNEECRVGRFFTQ